MPKLLNAPNVPVDSIVQKGSKLSVRQVPIVLREVLPRLHALLDISALTRARGNLVSLASTVLWVQLKKLPVMLDTPALALTGRRVFVKQGHSLKLVLPSAVTATFVRTRKRVPRHASTALMARFAREDPPSLLVVQAITARKE